MNKFVTHSQRAKHFWTKVDKNGPVHPILKTRCWVWTAGVFHEDHGGSYGQFYGFLETRAHRVAYILSHNNKPIPKELMVLHRCDNTLCVRPGHLFLGTHQDNMRDMVNKGRSASGDRASFRVHPESRPFGNKNGSRKHPERLKRGEDHPSAKLTEAIVRKIRQRYATGGISQESLGMIYGVGQNTISAVILRQTWKHVR